MCGTFLGAVEDFGNDFGHPVAADDTCISLELPEPTRQDLQDPLSALRFLRCSGRWAGRRRALAQGPFVWFYVLNMRNLADLH